MKRVDQGFSLIELMVVLAIVALALFTLMPDVTGWVRNIRLRAAAESIQNGLQRAREEALRRNTPVIFSLVTAANPEQLDSTCALSSAGPGWVVSLATPAGQCGNALSSTATPYIVAKYAPGTTSANQLTVAATNASNNTASSVTFDYLGNVVNATDITTIDVAYTATASSDVALRIQIAPSGGVVRLCNKKITDTNDPRTCF